VASSINVKNGTQVRLGRAWNSSVGERLMAMLLLTALLHAIILLGVSFGDGTPIGGAESPKLDVMLASSELPEARANARAAYLAQRTQIGAGNTELARPIASPSSRAAAQQRHSPEAGNEQQESSAKPSGGVAVLTSSGESPEFSYVGALSSAGTAGELDPINGESEGEERSGGADTAQLLLKGRADAQHWVTPDTRASRLAPYLTAWKHKVERVGNLNYPTVIRDAALSGSPVVEVQIGANGKLVEARVRRGSGYQSLDEAALAILKLASPFDPFPPDLAADYARLRFAYQWDFVAGSLQSGAVTVSSDRASGP
jgi:periplasmic protein TonB